MAARRPATSRHCVNQEDLIEMPTVAGSRIMRPNSVSIVEMSILLKHANLKLQAVQLPCGQVIIFQILTKSPMYPL
jgi:hypothetical protein